MDEKITLADLLSEYMTNKFGDARLASLVNQVVADCPNFLHRSTVRNWRTGTVKEVRGWQQLVAIANVLSLNESKANELLKAAGLPTIRELRKQASYKEKKLFTIWPESILQGTPIEKPLDKIFCECEANLIAGRDADTSAKVLGNIAIEYEHEKAVLTLWKAVCKTNKLYVIINPCAYTIGRIVWQPLDPSLENICFDIFKESISTKSELIIDKFAYTVGEVVLKAKKDKTRQRAMQFMNTYGSDTDPLVKDKYTFTKNRIARTIDR